MRHGYKGFTLVELMVTIAVLAILVTIGIPSFVGLINNTKADTESTDLYRALNYARLEAINRGASIRVTPSIANDWTSRLDIQVVNAGVVTNPVLRVIADMSASAVVTPKDIANIEYNNLGALANPVTAVAFSYTQGTYTKAIGVCLNGRVILGGTCP